MRHNLTLLLSTVAIRAFVRATPALAQVGNGNDLNAQTEQAQLHPSQANESPNYIPDGVPAGEVYPSAGPYAFYGPDGVRPASPYGYAYGAPYVAVPAYPLAGPVGAAGAVAGALVAAPFNAAAGIVGGLTAAPAYGYGACTANQDFNGRRMALCGP
jgi:hypothetical protein